MKYKRENEFIEFKESLSQLSRGLESITAMLNKHGNGVVLFGVKDDGSILGVNIGNKTLKDISDAVAQKIKPIVIPIITEEEYDGKVVIKLECSGYNKPYSADGKYLIRSGNENKKIDPEVMRQLLFSNSIETMTNIESYDQELSFTQLKQLYISRGLPINDNMFNKNNGLYTKDGKYNILASILADNNNCSIKVVKFDGIDKSNMISRNEFGYKCLIIAMENALEYTQSMNETKVVISDKSVREEVHLFDSSSLREAWNNACLHTRWDRMVPPSIYIFSNRIEIISTGGLPIDYSVDDFYQGISNPINKQLQKIMGQLGLVEQTGHGVPEIVKHYGKEAFEITDNHIKVTLKFPYNIKVGESDYSSLNPSQTKVLKAITNEPTITTNGLVDVVGLKTSRIAEIIKELKELKRIERVGSNKTGYWKVNK
ncbi:MAG: putative DNA binding domain-containing protein [Acholeplasmatales bacterium]|nr:putative DNA binding domain-containing protein [Acholeplasmatales bacterium]